MELTICEPVTISGISVPCPLAVLVFEVVLVCPLESRLRKELSSDRCLRLNEVVYREMCGVNCDGILMV